MLAGLAALAASGHLVAVRLAAVGARARRRGRRSRSRRIGAQRVPTSAATSGRRSTRCSSARSSAAAPVLQPAARLPGRLARGLSPWRRHRTTGFAIPRRDGDGLRGTSPGTPAQRVSRRSSAPRGAAARASSAAAPYADLGSRTVGRRARRSAAARGRRGARPRPAARALARLAAVREPRDRRHGRRSRRCRDHAPPKGDRSSPPRCAGIAPALVVAATVWEAGCGDGDGARRRRPRRRRAGRRQDGVQQACAERGRTDPADRRGDIILTASREARTRPVVDLAAAAAACPPLRPAVLAPGRRVAG